MSNERIPLENDQELKDWFRTYYVKWMETCDNLRWLSSGKGEKNPQALIPFLPFGEVPGLPYTTMLMTLIDVLVGRIPNEPAHPLGNPGHMASIIEEPCEEIPPYILLEWVYGGVVTRHLLFKNTTWERVSRELRNRRMPYSARQFNKKFVTTPFLRKLYRLHRDWLDHGDNARYLIDFMFTLHEGIREGQARVEPLPRMFENFKKIKGQIHITPADGENGRDGERELYEWLRRLASRLPNLSIQTRQGEIPIDLGGRCTVSIPEVFLFALLDGLRFNDNLAGFTSHMLAFTQKGLVRGWISFAGLKWLSRLIARIFKRRMYALSGKTQILAKIMANPFRLAIVQTGGVMILTMENGGLERVDLNFHSDAVPGKTRTLKEQWLTLCQTQGFINLAVSLRETPQDKYWTLRPPGDLSVLQGIEFYPHNDFVRFILRKGPLQLLFNVVMPFLSA